MTKTIEQIRREEAKRAEIKAVAYDECFLMPIRRAVTSARQGKIETCKIVDAVHEALGVKL